MANRADLFALLAGLKMAQAQAAPQTRPTIPPPGPLEPIQAMPANAPMNHNAVQGIHWGGGSFANPAELVAWMNSRGAATNVGQFLGNHPGVAAQFGQRRAAPRRAPSILSRLANERPLGMPRPKPLQHQVQRHVRQQFPQRAAHYAG